MIPSLLIDNVPMEKFRLLIPALNHIRYESDISEPCYHAELQLGGFEVRMFTEPTPNIGIKVINPVSKVEASVSMGDFANNLLRGPK